MNLIYFSIFFGKEVSGVQKKILAQVKNLNILGINAVVFSITGTDDNSPPLQNVNKIIITTLECNSPKNFFDKIKRVHIRDDAFKNIIETLKSDEILYTRIPTPSGRMAKILKNPRRCKIVVEYQTIEPRENRLNRNYLSLIYDFLYGDDIRTYTDGIVGVTDEITRYEAACSGNPPKPHITIGNGIDVDSVMVRTYSRFTGKELRLLCVANVNRWHGLDRLIRGLATYRGSIPVTLNIVGDGAELPHLKKLSNDFNLTDRVFFHGIKTGNDLDYFFNTSHIAVGSLGIHRKGLTQTSELKAREYCARGIPYILACADPDFPEDFPFIHRILPDESPVNIEEVVEFARNVCEDPGHPQKMREYAGKHLDWSVKMTALKSFLETLEEESTQNRA